MPTNDTLATAIAALDKAKQLVEVATDWNLEEVEIDGEMMATYSLIEVFDAAIADLKQQQADSAAVTMPVADWSNAPAWAMWWTMDMNGKQDWWEKEPILKDEYAWWLYDWSKAPYRHCRVEFRPDENKVDWRTLKQRRPAQE